VVEVMGRNAGWIALHAGVAGGGDIILIPEIPYSLEVVCRVIEERTRKGRKSSIVVLAEGAGRAVDLAPQIGKATGRECKAVVLGYLQRGGTPTPFDRLLASELGYAAARSAAGKQYGSMVAWRGAKAASVPLSEVAGRTRTIAPDCPLLGVARGVGTSFGESPSRLASG
jgi:6-phosphofructokinase 1